MKKAILRQGSHSLMHGSHMPRGCNLAGYAVGRLAALTVSRSFLHASNLKLAGPMLLLHSREIIQGLLTSNPCGLFDILQEGYLGFFSCQIVVALPPSPSANRLWY